MKFEVIKDKVYYDDLAYRWEGDEKVYNPCFRVYLKVDSEDDVNPWKHEETWVDIYEATGWNGTGPQIDDFLSYFDEDELIQKYEISHAEICAIEDAIDESGIDIWEELDRARKVHEVMERINVDILEREE